ncbi:hypothetical protein BDW74DRAFT_189546 [Aspergillus multicolor]|uniref:uncharacterized protein n=1 Tax=Aspergillus multicolor TaxID=41759 RepID=UPI003CCE540C
MSPFLVNGHFPPIPLTQASTSTNTNPNPITTEERSTAIDFINRHNFIFQEWNHAKMLATFLPDAVVYHSHGTVRGHAEFQRFFEEVYGFFITGIGRSATNHIETLIRYGWGSDEDPEADVVAGRDVVRSDGLPAVWWFGQIVDRLRMTEDGWRVHERYLGASFRNGRLDFTKG